MGWTLPTTTTTTTTTNPFFGLLQGNNCARKRASIESRTKHCCNPRIRQTEVDIVDGRHRHKPQHKERTIYQAYQGDGSPFSCRRKFMLVHGISPAAFLVASSTIGVQPAAAADATSVSEAVRRGASSLPGYGPSDIFYPKSWKGTWKVRRQLVLSSERDNVNAPTTTTLEYLIRFIPSIQDDAVVADRGYNQANLEVAQRQLQRWNKDFTTTVAGVQSVQWTETNPNDLSVQMTDGATTSIKVTKRATERTETTVQSSEFQRVVTTDRESSIPDVTARRVLTKWKAALAADDGTSNSNEPTVLEALEIVYDMGSQGDPLSYSMGTNSNGEPRMLCKSRLFLERY